MLERDRRDKVLIVLHQGHSTPGRIGASLRQRGYALDIRRPSLGDPLPETLAEHAGAIVFGGPMSANDEDASGSAARSTGSPFRSKNRSRCSASASARRCSPANWAPGCSPSRISAAKSAITRSRRRRRPTACARRRFRVTSITGIATASSCRAGRGCWPRAPGSSPIRLSPSANRRWRCSSTPKSPTR